MCNASFLSASGTVPVNALAAYQSAASQRAAAKAQAKIASNNAKIAGWQAEDALKQGDRTVSDYNIKSDQFAGRQRAAIASNGLVLDEGSAANMLQDTQIMAQIDTATIRNNAARSAWGFQVGQSNAQATQSMLLSQAKQINTGAAVFGSLMNDARQVSNMWMKGGMGA